jgi:glucosamine--fructose-6-phosphate aminotransferase (isomerizing)
MIKFWVIGNYRGETPDLGAMVGLRPTIAPKSGTFHGNSQRPKMFIREVSMENKLWSEILMQGENLGRVVRHLYGPERSRLEAAAAFLQNDRPVLFIGVASAAYLCMPSELYLGQRGRCASVICASDALYSLLPALERANVVINSRSGETAEIVRLGHALVERGIPFVAVTNEPGSTLAGMATHRVWCNTHQDELVSINVVTGMMAATLALSAAFVGELDRMRPEFERLVEPMEEVVGRSARAAAALQELFSGFRPVYLLSRGYSKGAAFCGRLVLEEVSRTPAVALDAAEFRQGPNEVIDDRFAAILFVPPGRQGELNLSLAGDILANGGRVLRVGEVGHAPGRSGELAFSIPAVPDALRPILEVVPVQVLAYRLAASQGIIPGEVRYISRVITHEEGIPRQNQ